jgi:hypothetical protein
MARKNTSEKKTASRGAEHRPRSTAGRAGASRPRTLRLTGTRVMTAAQQQRFEMLFDALVARWLARSGSNNKGEGND